ncbi:hypothetical protein CYV26_06475 [Carnobacterium maltaromaticum]|uniref:tyrosine-type recombinase/integrase n=1 Tax=Carnobacterium maltaromaticum TaxID=2751 RepID=UPI000C76E5FE|nr:tyrosine-type recombinase/integrase [Carnobacterium maltaromaticum]PLS38350.1 hypothetical protein CYV33_03940 [Carnobacterium maltaromaticum]PLS38727.1 hypothetical protein CYV31_06465 [Carnobacterium maltaromaticum]PLS39104.1 hypothetical protein CYV30_03935 [Carnobacterium maltaromaticum]PLS45374.1 hypothetical protein CYV28_03935 [Carnobacterium maltaromaticum]PLS48230.1 hypothetical protein CYV27_01975 [Carnobacterium maltaromaticum]
MHSNNLSSLKLKTDAGKRKITIKNNLADELQSWKETQTARLSRFTDDVEQLQVFQFAPSIMVTNKYNAILERTTNLKRIRIHDFRHSHIALLIENREKEFPIKQRLGHTSIQMTYGTYGHLYPSKQKSMSDKLNDLF